MNLTKLIGAVGMLTMLAGCAAPVHLSDGMNERVFTPCTDDAFCFRNSYGVAREHNCNEFPVTFRNNEFEYKSNKYEWIYQTTESVPASATVYRK
jgi:hypothetical protein